MNKTAIHIFNPEADYALAEFKESYTPPAPVVKLRRSLALTPLRFARPEDYILILDNPDTLLSDSPDKADKQYKPTNADKSNNSDKLDKSDELNYSDKLDKSDELDNSDNRIITPARFKEFFRKVSERSEEYEIRPWNWTPDLRHRLRHAGAPESLLPSDETLLRIRAIASRSTTIPFNEALNIRLPEKGLSKHISPLPLRFEDVDDAMGWWKKTGEKAFFKYPWSSSGRGVMLADLNLPAAKLKQWIAGGIRKQGYVMAETFFPKSIDFATEWQITDGKASFIGLSLFSASENGNYISNEVGRQSELLKIISGVAPDFNQDFIEAQRDSLDQVIAGIAPGYNGYAGIDMMASANGRIRGGVELNFRMTMGIVALLENNQKY